jgi:hypothetical protein
VKSPRAVALGGLAAAGLWLGAGPASAEPRLFELSIRAGVLPESSRVVRVRQGDDVTILWTADTPLTIHLHGYDLQATMAPGAPVSMRLTARATGRFPLDVHARGSEKDRTIGYLEVHPR